MKKRPDSTLEDLRHVVALATLARTASIEQQAQLRPVIDALEARVGPTTGKRRAAALLGISPQALDAWIRVGRVETRADAGGTRSRVDTASLIWTAQQIPAGAPRPARHVDRARLRRRRADDFWRFNAAATAADVRAVAALPLAERIHQIDALNSSMHFVQAMRDRSAGARADVASEVVPDGA